jgi:hypothetical protein
MEVEWFNPKINLSFVPVVGTKRAALGHPHCAEMHPETVQVDFQESLWRGQGDAAPKAAMNLGHL